MRGSNALISAAVSASASAVAVTLAIAGADKVAFPAYQSHVLYDVLDQPENKEVRELYVNPEVLRNFKPGQPLPSGTVLTAPTFKAVLDDKGEFVRDANGRLVRGRLDRIVQAMQLGAKGYVMKPFDGPKLISEVRAVLKG